MKKYSLIIVICLICLTGCFWDNYDEYEIPEDVIITENDNTYDVFSTVDTKDLVNVTNADVLSEDILEVNETGKFTYTIELKYKKRTYKYNASYVVKDVTAPVFISAASTRTIQVEDVLYPCNAVVYADDYDTAPTCYIDGEYDLTTVGTYNVSYVIRDSSGNESRKDLKINVLEELPQTTTSKSTTSTKTYFSDIVSNYKNDNTMIGIDVSKWQGDIDFEAVKNAGCEFVIIRIGVNNDVDKDLTIDSYFKQNIEKAKAAGLKVGVYLYTTATTEEKATEHAKWIIDTLDGESLDFPVVFDWENWSKFMKYQLSLHNFNNVFYTFADVLSTAGYDAMLYSSKYYLNNTIWENKYNYPVWLAHYTNHTDYTGDYYMWQMCNDGKIDGINADVDIDILYLDKAN